MKYTRGGMKLTLLPMTNTANCRGSLGTAVDQQGAGDRKMSQETFATIKGNLDRTRAKILRHVGDGFRDVPNPFAGVSEECELAPFLFGGLSAPGLLTQGGQGVAARSPWSTDSLGSRQLSIESARDTLEVIHQRPPG